MKLIVFCAIALSTAAQAETVSRGLPQGSTPWPVTAVFASPAGEVEKLEVPEAGGGTAFLRKPSGMLLPLIAVNGPENCGEWLASKSRDLPPQECEFHFEDRENVRGGDFEVASLFQSVSKATRARREAHVAL